MRKTMPLNLQRSRPPEIKPVLIKEEIKEEVPKPKEAEHVKKVRYYIKNTYTTE